MTEAAWSPDGRQLAFVMGTDSALRVAIANADGSGLRLVGPELVAPEVIDDGAIDIAWAPDVLSLVMFGRGCARSSGVVAGRDLW